MFLNYLINITHQSYLLNVIQLVIADNITQANQDCLLTAEQLEPVNVFFIHYVTTLSNYFIERQNSPHQELKKETLFFI